MKVVDLNIEIEISDPDLEIEVEVDYKCYFDANKYMAMTLYGTIAKNYPLQKTVANGKKDYERFYERVEIAEVRADTDALIAELNKEK